MGPACHASREPAGGAAAAERGDATGAAAAGRAAGAPHTTTAAVARISKQPDPLAPVICLSLLF